MHGMREKLSEECTMICSEVASLYIIEWTIPKISIIIYLCLVRYH